MRDSSFLSPQAIARPTETFAKPLPPSRGKVGMGVKKASRQVCAHFPPPPGFRLSPVRRRYASDWKSAHAPYPGIRGSPTGTCADPASVIISSPSESPSIACAHPHTHLSSPPYARNSVGEPPLCKHFHRIELPTIQRLGRVAYRRLLRYIPPVRNAICLPLNWRRAGQAKGGTINKRLALQRILRATSSVG